MENVNVCCICKREFAGKGNNPFPYKNYGVCCNVCNLLDVVPARILKEKIKKNEYK